MNWRFAIGLLAILAAGCAHSTVVHTPAQPLLPYPLSPVTLGHDLSLSQTVTGEYSDQTRTMRIELEVTSTRLVVVGLSSFGIPVFSLELVGDHVEATSTGSEELSLDPYQALSDIQLAYWPAEAVRVALASKGLRLNVDATDSSRRVYSSDDLLMVEITYYPSASTPQEILIQHFDPTYKLRVTTIGGED